MEIAYRFINFAVIVFLYVKFLRPRIAEFFYARMVLLQKRATKTKNEKDEARRLLEASRERLARTGEDIARLVKGLEAACMDECKTIEEEAAKRVRYLIGLAKMQAEAVKDRYVKEVRSVLLEEAFRKAENELQGAVPASAQKERALKAIAAMPQMETA